MLQKARIQSNTFSVLQPKLEIGKVDDPHEKEADAVADKVMRMPSGDAGKVERMGDDAGSGIRMQPEAEEEKMPPENEAKIKMKAEPVYPLQRKSAGSNENSLAPEAVEQGISSSKGSGQSLDAGVRKEMGSKIGADFSDVKVHTDTNAEQMNREIGAKAFAHGNDIYFNKGQYNPASSEGKHLLAHELIHTVQQGAAIQRSIEIDGKPYTPTAADYSKYNKELLDKMHNGGLPPVNTFKTQSDFEDALNIRISSVANMNAAIEEDNTSVTFGLSPETGYFELPAEFWEPMDVDWFRMKKGTDITPAKAINSIFNNGKKESYLDCNMLMVALQYKSILDTYGDEKFNLMFPGGKDLVISQVGVRHSEEEYPIASGMHPFDDKSIYDNVLKQNPDSDTNKIKIDVTDPTKDLIPGDWVYFKNIPEYTAYISRANNLSIEQYTITKEISNMYGNAWQGEHALYVGDNKFQGFGLSGTYTYDEMLTMLYNSFHDALLAYYDHPYYKKKYINDGGERNEMLAKTQKDWPSAKITSINRLNTNNISNLGK